MDWRFTGVRRALSDAAKGGASFAGRHKAALGGVGAIGAGAAGVALREDGVAAVRRALGIGRRLSNAIESDAEEKREVSDVAGLYADSDL